MNKYIFELNQLNALNYISMNRLKRILIEILNENITN